MNSTSQELFYLSLKKKRESQGIEIAEISEQTKINPKYFIEFEKGNFEVLPQVYTRLFLRSYAVEIGADPDKVLEDFEVHTTGKIQPKKEIKIPETQKNTDKESDYEDSIFKDSIWKDFNQKNLIGIIASVIIIILIVAKLRDITSDTTAGIENNPPSTNQTVQPKITKNTNIPGSFLDNYNRISQKTISLGIFPPYTLSVTSTEHTSIKIKIIENGVTSLDRILELKPAQELIRNSKGKLEFELRSTENISIKLNDNNQIISQFLKPANISKEDLAIKVNLEEDGSLTAEYFQVN